MGHRWHRGRETWRLACRLPAWATVCSSPHSSRHTSNQSTAICWNRDLAITCSGKGRSENYVTPPFEQPTCKNKSIFFKFEFWKCESKNKKKVILKSQFTWWDGLMWLVRQRMWQGPLFPPPDLSPALIIRLCCTSLRKVNISGEVNIILLVDRGVNWGRRNITEEFDLFVPCPFHGRLSCGKP